MVPLADPGGAFRVNAPSKTRWRGCPPLIQRSVVMIVFSFECFFLLLIAATSSDSIHEGAFSGQGETFPIPPLP